MKVQDLMSFFNVGTFSALGKKMGVCKATVSNWNANGIPIEQQALIQVGTNNKLKADSSKIKQYD